MSSNHRRADALPHVAGFSLPASHRQRVEFATLLVVMTAFTTGPVYVFAVRILNSQSSWEDRWIRLAFIAAALGGSAAWLSAALDRRLKRLDLGLVLAGIFTSAALLSTLWSILPRQTLWRSLVYVGLLATAWLLASLRFEVFSLFMICLAGFGTVASLLVRVVRPDVGLDGSGGWRGIYTNPNSLGPICALFILSLVYMILRNTDWRIRAAGIVAIALTAVPLVGSASDTAIVALALSVIVGIALIAIASLWKAQRRNLAIALGAGGAVVSVAVLAVLQSRLRATTGIQQRTDVWGVVWERILIKPQGGYGFFTYWGTGASQSPRFLARAGSAHNSALEAALDIGLGGLVLITALGILASVKSVRDALVAPSSRTLYWLMLTIFVVASHLTESFMSWFSYLWVLLIVVAADRLKTTQAPGKLAETQ